MNGDESVLASRDKNLGSLLSLLNPVFSIYRVVQENDVFYFYGTPRMEAKDLYQVLWNPFLELGYQFTLKHELGEHVVVASPYKPQAEGVWINILLMMATVFTTMVMGSLMFGVNPLDNPGDIIRGLPFTLAIMGVLGAHEMGHYLVAKRHGMRTSLPYFIPVPLPPIGTMGAVIKHKGPIPNRKALFDVGVAGPLIGLIASIAVTIIGILQPPLDIPVSKEAILFQLPPLFEIITWFIPIQADKPLHPVAFAGWVGMLVTALNLLPAGQLDGGHVLRSMLGERFSRISKAMPFVLIVLWLFVTFVLKENGSIWLFWGLFLSLFASAGHPMPLDDELRLDGKRFLLGIFTFLMGGLCVTLSPFQVP